MTARTLARLTLGACAVAVTVTPTGSWSAAVIGAALILAGTVELHDPGTPALSPWAGALDTLKEMER